MNRKLAWMTSLVAGALAGSTAAAQAPKATAQPTPTPTQRTAPPATPKAGTAPTAKAAPAPAPTLDPAAQKAALARAQGQMDVLLDEWEKQSSKVRSLQVVFERRDKMPKWGDKYYQGQAFLQSPDLACLEFKLAQVDKDGKPVYTNGPNGQPALVPEKDATERIVCTGREVLQFMWDVRKIYRYPLDKEARDKALQQGPLPFLFNMKAAEAKQRYTMILKEQSEKAYLIQIVPRQEIDQKSFRQAYIYLSKQSFMPDRLILFPVGDQEMQDFRFTMIVPNGAINAKIFNPDIRLPGWEIVDNPDATAKDPAKAVGVRPVGAPASTSSPGSTVSPTAPSRAATQAQAPKRGASRP